MYPHSRHFWQGGVEVLLLHRRLHRVVQNVHQGGKFEVLTFQLDEEFRRASHVDYDHIEELALFNLTWQLLQWNIYQALS